jgi:hypothetical protein
MVGYSIMAFGPALLGLARDLAGFYTIGIGLCIALRLLGSSIVLWRR